MSTLKKLQVLPVLGLLCLVVSCGEYKGHYAENASPDSIATAYDPDTVGITAEQHKLLVRKATLTMKVKDIRVASDHIRRLTKRVGGEIWNSNWYTNEFELLRKQISPDSILSVSNLQQHHDLTLRIPTHYLDSLLYGLEQEADVLISKQTSTENVGLEHLSNDLKSKNSFRSITRHESRPTKSVSDLDYTMAENHQLQTAESIVDYQIRNLKLQDESNFSTVTISLVQEQNIHHTLTFVPNPEKYDPPYYAEIGSALADGMKFISVIFLGLLRIWPLYLLAFAGWKVYTLFRPKKIAK